jgi:hypothetical protein
MARGDYERLDGDWSNTQTVAATWNRIFAICSGTLYVIEPEVGAWRQLTGGWDPAAMTALGDQLFVFERSGALYRADTEGRYETLTGGWREPRAAAACGGAVYAMDGGTLYRVAPDDGAWTQLDGSWDTARMTALGDALFMWERGGSLYRATTDGAWTQLDGSWPATTAVAAHGTRLYAVDSGVLYDVDPATGAWTHLGGSWSTAHLAPCGRHLFAFETGGSLYRITV